MNDNYDEQRESIDEIVNRLVDIKLLGLNQYIMAKIKSLEALETRLDAICNASDLLNDAKKAKELIENTIKINIGNDLKNLQRYVYSGFNIDGSPASYIDIGSTNLKWREKNNYELAQIRCDYFKELKSK